MALPGHAEACTIQPQLVALTSPGVALILIED